MRRARRRAAAAVVVLVVGGAAGCAGAATPEERFVAEVRAAGVWPSDSDADLLANEPCGWLEGAHARDGVLGIVEAIDAQDSDDYPDMLAEFLIYAGAAVEHLCPDLREPWRAAVDLYGDGAFSTGATS